MKILWGKWFILLPESWRTLTFLQIIIDRLFNSTERHYRQFLRICVIPFTDLLESLVRGIFCGTADSGWVPLNSSKMTLPKTLTLATLALLITITGAREDRQIRWPNQEPVVGLGKDGVQNDQPGIRKKVLEVLGGRHAVQYSEPVLDTDYQSSRKFNPR